MHIDPTPEQIAVLKSLPQDQPVMMLNLLRLRAVANYEDGRKATGIEAYTTYGTETAPIFQGVGGEMIWRGQPEAMVIGPAAETWHIAFIARYPTGGAFFKMITDPAYQAITFHRKAAVEDSRLIRMGEV